MLVAATGSDAAGNEPTGSDAAGSSTLTSFTKVYSEYALSASVADVEAGILYKLSSGSAFKVEPEVGQPPEPEVLMAPKLILVFVIKAEAPWTESIGSALVTVTVISSWPLSSASSKLLYLCEGIELVFSSFSLLKEVVA